MRLPMAVPPVLGFAALYPVAVLVGAAGSPDYFWPAAGVAAVWLATSRWRLPEAALVGMLTLAGLLVMGSDWRDAVSAALGAAGGALAFAYAAARWLPGHSGGSRPSPRLPELWRLLLCTMVSAAAAALLRTLGDQALGREWTTIGAVTGLVRDAVAILVVGMIIRQVILTVADRGRQLRQVTPAGWLECAAVFVVSAVAYWYVFISQEELPIGFALIALTVWGATRMPIVLVLAHATVFTTVAVLCTWQGIGPYATVADPGSRDLIIQLYAGIVGTVGLALALSRDERDSLIERLQASEQEATDKATMMTTVVNSMTEGLAILDHTGRLVLRNPAAGRLLGAASTVSGQVALGTDHGFFRPDGTALTDAELPHVRALAGEDVEPMDVLVRNGAVPEGRIVRFNTARLALGAGPYHVVVIFHDVTADRRHRDELMSFSGRVAHNLLNPLTTIEGWAEVLEQELAGYQPAERVVRIQRAAARMRTFLNGLLAYTAARDGKLMPTTVNLALLVGDIVNSRLDRADSLRTAPPYFEVGRLDPVEADPVLLRQLLESLIDNSMRTMPPGVAPYLAISCQPAPNGLLRIDILDNGIGIPPGTRHEIFTNFHRDKGTEATGLELAICKRIVERHGGTIEAMANPYGQGTRMSFTLPAGRSAYARALAPSS